MTTEQQEKIYWSTFKFNEWQLYIAKSAKGLCYIGTPHESFSDLKTWMSKHVSSFSLIENEQILKPYVNELIEYFNGERKQFSIPLDLRGTDFQRSVWNALSHIPYGKTYSYSQIAQSINRPKAVRAVGTAIGANPILIVVPCHRVISKNGALTGFRAGLDMKEFLLQLEKVL